MLTTFIVALREFLEVFLIIGVFLGISKKLGLKRGKEIVLASLVGVIFSLVLPLITFAVGDRARLILTEKNADLLEAYLMVFSGFFIAYVIFSLHNFFVLKRSKLLISAHQKLQENIFDISLFATIVFFIVREGFEIALFTATTALFSRFMENMIGLLIGFLISGAIGVLTYLAYIKLPIGKVFKVTEYLIILLGATFVKNGLTGLLTRYFNLDLANVYPLTLHFLPDHESFIGHLLQNFIGLEQEFSLAKLSIMVIYFFVIYNIFLKKKYK